MKKCSMCHGDCESLVRSHLMPLALFSDLLGDNSKYLKKVDLAKEKANNTSGVGAPFMYKICSDCENKFQKVDSKFIILYRNCNILQKIPEDINRDKIYRCSAPQEWDLRLLDVFCASILLRYHLDGQISLGKYYNVALEMLEKFNNNEAMPQNQSSIVAMLFVDTAREATKNVISSDIVRPRFKSNIKPYMLHLSSGLSCLIRVSNRKYDFETVRDDYCIPCFPFSNNMDSMLISLARKLKQS